MKKFRFLLNNVAAIATLFVLFSGCEDEEIAPVIPPAPQASFIYRDLIDWATLSSTSTGEISEYLWQVSDVDHQSLLKSHGNYADLVIPTVATTITVSLTVKNSGGSSTCTENIDLPELTFCRKYGLGRNVESERSNNVDYEWYIDQTTTGQYANMNCGPACATMALKWANKNFNKTTEDARNSLPILQPTPGWTSGFFTSYLTDNHTKWDNEYYTEANQLKNQIDNGNIFALGLNMFYIKYESKSEWRIDRFYVINSTFKHFIIVKGYKIVDSILWFEVYDPWSVGWINMDDGSLKGRDRYYRSEDIIESAYDIDPFPKMIVIYRTEE